MKISNIYCAFIALVFFIPNMSSQVILIDKCEVSSNSSPIKSGQQFSYVIQLTIPPGTQDLKITDQLSPHLGTSMAMLSPIEQQIDQALNLPPGTTAISYTGGVFKPCNPGTFGGEIEVNIPATIVNGQSLTFVVTVWSVLGEMFNCIADNWAIATAGNIIDPNTNSPEEFRSNTLCFDIQAENDWRIKKELLGYTGVNVAQYKISISRSNSSPIGYYNLYSVDVSDIAPAGAIIHSNIDVSNFPSGFNGVCLPSGNTLNCALNTLKVCEFTYGQSQHFIIEIEYPCAQFSANQQVDNCISLSGRSPRDCNFYPFNIFNPPNNVIPPNSSSGLCSTGCPSKVPYFYQGGVAYFYPWLPLHTFHDETTDSNFEDCVSHLLPQNFGVTADFLKYKVNANSNDAPGCQGQYILSLCNTGVVPLSNIAIIDDFAENDLNLLGAVSCISGSACTGINIDYWCGSWTNTPCSNPNEIRFVFPTNYTLNPGDCIKFRVDYEIPTSAIPGTSICNNCTYSCATGTCCNCAQATFDGMLNVSAAGCNPPPPIPTQNICACLPLTVEEACPRLFFRKDVISGQQTYLPGDIVKYRLCIANFGGAALNGTITDNLHPDLIFNGNITYSESPNSSSPCTGSTNLNYVFGFVPGSSSGTIALPANCTNNQWATSIIEYEAVVDQGVSWGQKTNTATVNVNSSTTCSGFTASDPATISVAQLPAANILKEVKGDQNAGWSSVLGQSAPGGTVTFRLTLENNGTVPLDNIVMADWLPQAVNANQCIISEQPPTNGNLSGSDFDVSYLSHTIIGSFGSPTATLSWHSSLPNPSTDMIQPASCGGTPPAPSTGQIMRLDFGNYLLPPGENIVVEINCQIPSSVSVGDNACNCGDIGACNPIGGASTPIPFAPSNQPCVEIVPFVPECCEELTIQMQPFKPTFQNQGTFIEMLQDVDFTAGPYPIQELRISIVDLNVNYDPDKACVQCYTPYQFLGTFFQINVPPSIGNLNYAPAWQDRELVYTGTPSLFTATTSLTLPIRLPILEGIPCCFVEGEICLKFTFKDVNCNYCEEVICLPINYTN